jgi:hypothetical protein
VWKKFLNEVNEEGELININGVVLILCVTWGHPNEANTLFFRLESIVKSMSILKTSVERGLLD